MASANGRHPEREATQAHREVIALWPGSPPTAIQGIGPEVMFSVAEGLAAGTVLLRNVSEASLTVFRPEPDKANGSSVIVCPGGGWKILFWEHEGVSVAEWFAKRGYTAFLLKYRLAATPEDPGDFEALMAQAREAPAEKIVANRPSTLEAIMPGKTLREAREIAAADGRRALQIVRQRASHFGLDPARIGMIGFSVGAALVVDVAIEPNGPPPAFIAPIYGGEVGARAIPSGASPLFAVVAQDDRLILGMVENLYLDWSRSNRSAELHVFARGGHGFGMRSRGLPSDRWVELLGDWLVEQGFG